jgi:dCTP deaminase
VILSDRSIRKAVSSGVLGIDPFEPRHVQPSSYDITLDLPSRIWLEPGRFHLLSTRETVRLPAHIQAHVHGRSSLGRLGVLIHFTAGLIDPGFDGQITLEVMALHERVPLDPGDRVGQLSFFWLDYPAQQPYRGRYQGQRGATESRFTHGDEPW